VRWVNYAVSGFDVAVETRGAAGTRLDVVLGAKDAGNSATIQVQQVQFTTSAVAGKIVVSAQMSGGVTFSPSSATDGIVVQTPPSAPSITLTATSQPKVTVGTSAAAAGDWTVEMAGNIGAGSGWLPGTVLTLAVAPPSGANCEGSGYLYFVGLPSVVVGSSSGVSSEPTVSPSLTYGAPCGSTEDDQLDLTFTNSGYFDTSGGGEVTLSIGGVRYAVGSTATSTGTGDVIVTASYSVAPHEVDVATASNAAVQVSASSTPAPPPPTTAATPQPQNGTQMVVKADTPPISLLQGAFDAPISPVEISGTATTPIPAGYVCLTLSSGSFNDGGDASVRVESGNGFSGAAVTYEDQTGTSAPAAEFEVSKASSVSGGYAVSGLAVNASTTAGPVTVVVTHGASADCARDTSPVGSATAFTVTSTPVTRIYGATPDATAAAELEHQFDAQMTSCPGRPGDRPVVLATDSGYPDALTSAYLASSLGTGELLTPPGQLSAAAADAIRMEGITQVYIVGGTLAVSSAESQELETMLAYNCGGVTPLTSAGPVHIEVTRIAGESEYDTAQWVAEFPTAGAIGSLDVAAAYGGTNPTGGGGEYNDTAGNGSAPPATATALPTAIVATGTSFQDAESASVLSYADHLPILLTTPTSLSTQVPSAISALGIRQVIVMGGPLAVSDADVRALEKLGLPVLRIAGGSSTETSVELARFEMASAAAHLGAGWSGTGAVTVARGDYFTDGLAGALVAAGAGREHTHGPEPLLLCTNASTVGASLSQFLTTAGRTGVDSDTSDRVSSVTVLGGPNAVSPSAVSTMIADL